MRYYVAFMLFACMAIGGLGCGGNHPAADAGPTDAGPDGPDGGGSPGLKVSAVNGKTGENGDKATFTLALASEPSADVKITLASSDESEGSVKPTTLTFTALSWNAPQTVTVTGVDDEAADGDQTYSITLAVASDDSRYADVTHEPVKLVNVDDDSAGLSVSAVEGKTGEDGAKATFTVALRTRPEADVTVPYHSDATDEGTVEPASLTFTTENWAAPQTVTITGVDDALADGDQQYGVVFDASTSMDARYAGLTADKREVTNVDNDSASIAVSEPSDDTGESGNQASFTVVLKSKPSADVTVHLASKDVSEGTTNKTSLTFTPDNWDAAQTVTVTGVDDALADGNQAYAIGFTGTTSDDADYAGLTPADVSLTNIDNDSPGISVSEISQNTTEAGGQATFTVALNSQPNHDVTVHFDSDDKGEGVVDLTALVFTAQNWSTPQTVTITGVDDDEADGAQPYAIAFSATTGDDAGYAGLTPGDVELSNVDDDSAGVSVSAISGDTGEDGTQATFTVVLNTKPSANVTLNLHSDDTDEGTIGQASLVFTPINWNAPQAVTVTGVDDSNADGQQEYSIVFAAATSDDAAYAAITPSAVSVYNIDDDSAGISVSTISGDVGEDGSQATFSVRLNSKPGADVTVHVASNDVGEGTLDKSSLTFTDINWNAPQTVTVTGIDDSLADGSQVFAVVFSATTSGDADYAAITPGNVTVSNIDNDTAGFSVSAASGSTGEDGTQATFTVVLNAEPTHDVELELYSDDASEGSLDKISLVFTPLNWNAPQTVTVTGLQDDLADGNQPYQIVFEKAVSSDAGYAALTPERVNLSNIDDDSAGIGVTPISGKTDEQGTQVSFSVVLYSQPFGDVTVHFASNDSSEGITDCSSLVFTSASWDAPQFVTVTGQNDDLADGEQPYAIVFGATTSSDAAYAAITPGHVNVANIDDDSAGITVSPISGDTDEYGAQAVFNIVLTSEPTADVTVHFASHDPAEGVTQVSSLTFTATNWAAPQTVLVTGQNDDVADGNQPYMVVFSATTSGDAAYAAITPGNVSVSNTDNDSAGILVSAISGNTNEGASTATFTIVLTSQPTGNVTLNFASSDASEGTTDGSTRTFTPVNWSAPQTVTVTGVNDNVADGTQPYSITFSATTSSDAAYAAITPGKVNLSNVDNDSAGITVSAISGNTTEAGGVAAFAIVLNSEPTANVTVSFATNDATEGATNIASWTFTSLNWNAPQAVVVTGVNDDVADGNQPYKIVFAATTSGDAAYAAITPASVSVTNTDNDTAGITVSGISGNTSETGGTATFTIVLTSQPTANVTVNFASNKPAEGITTGNSKLFTSANWSTPQSVTVTGQNDAVDDGNQPYAIVFSATTSADATYAAITPGNVAVTNTDDDTAGFTLTPISRNTNEFGRNATFTIKLNSQPTANVTVNFSSSRPAEGVPDSTSKTFTAANWNTAQTVTVTGQSDSIADGNQTYAIVFAATTSSDAEYAAIKPSNVAVVNEDKQGMVIATWGGLTWVKVPVTGTMNDTNVRNACLAQGLNVPCQTNQGSSCQYNDSLCVSATQENSCGNPMMRLSQAICGGASPYSCPALYGVFTYMGQNWGTYGSCGAQSGNWCVIGSSTSNQSALCVQ